MAGALLTLSFTFKGQQETEYTSLGNMDNDKCTWTVHESDSRDKLQSSDCCLRSHPQNTYLSCAEGIIYRLDGLVANRMTKMNPQVHYKMFLTMQKSSPFNYLFFQNKMLAFCILYTAKHISCNNIDNSLCVPNFCSVTVTDWFLNTYTSKSLYLA